ncbi:actin binding Rho activating protein b [Melanotaenia boesemani]|uniref:actin binding Rho activating protein b n=1 Tax=Melanotaenia boesemani TaxID=1250792 RepID=UPI001C04520A|nr:actin binding Rho activating protein b [Melanotaenia boesemani]
MSDEQIGQAYQRKPSSNKYIKKLRAVSTVCGLASSWQKWVTDNEKKQASEPSGWAPSSLEGPTEEPRKKWVPKKPPPVQTQPTSDSQIMAKTSTSSGSSNNEEFKTLDDPLLLSRIKTKQVVKTVTSNVQEKSAAVRLLTEKIKKEPSDEEIDRLLKKKSSPTRRRKCSNMVSSLTKSWKQVENERKVVKQGQAPGGGRSCVVDKEDRDLKEEKLDVKDSPAKRISKAEEQNDSEEDSVRIKRPQVSTYNKEAEDANKINTLSKKYSTVGNLKSRWQNWAVEHTVNQKLNPFSEYFDYDYSMSLRLQKGEEGYGRPKEGTKTAERAKRAEQHIHREIADLCYVIRTMADPGPDGKIRITFGELFDRYVRISDKVVGILMRARKHGKVAFEGEMLWQGRDDGVIITLLV